VDIGALIDSFSTGSYVVTRAAHGTTLRGRVQEGAQTTFSITAGAHPARGSDLLRLPEGRRNNETRVLFTTTQLQIGGIDADFEADLVDIDGEDWEVQHVETWHDPRSARVGYRCLVQARR
jgi:hypothetical protein